MADILFTIPSKKAIISIFLIIFSLTLNAQFYSPNGGPFTPKGDLRFLVIYAGFENSCDGFAGLWPNVVPGQPDCKTFPLYSNELFYSDFKQFSPTASDKSISNFYYQMSRNHPVNPPLRIIADIFPERINITGSHHNNYEVFKQINSRYPNFDWSRYDQRKNSPNFQFDNSQTGPDNVIDYVVIIWRQIGNSGRAGIECGFTFSTNRNGTFESYRVLEGFTITHGMSDNLSQMKCLFHHELAHTLFNCPHLFGVSGAYGSYFYASSGWGTMSYGSINSSANSWESWYNGWIELGDKDLNCVKHNGIYTLNDFVSTGDAMRIKLPFCNQYLWIENHAGLTVFDEREEFVKDGFNNEIPSPDKGLYMFVEGIVDDRSKKINSPLNLLYANGVKALHSKGNYDYHHVDYTCDGQWWKNIVVNFIQGNANPTSAHNDITLIRDNYKFDSIYPEKIIYRSFTNNRDEYCMICSENCTGGMAQEVADVVKKNGVFTYDALGVRMAFGNDPLHNKIGISSNPVLINHQRYICPDKLEPILLNGISIKILSKSSNGNITFEVKFNDTEISLKQRFTGDLVLNDIENAEYDLMIKSKNTLTIDKSGSPNRYNKGALVNGEYEFPDFINPSILTLDSNSKVLIERRANLVVANGSTLRIRSGAKFAIQKKAKLKIEAGAYLCIEPGAIVINEGRIKMSKKAIRGINPKLRLREAHGK